VHPVGSHYTVAFWHNIRSAGPIMWEM